MTPPGCSQAAGISVHEAVRDLYAKHYSANIMKLVLYGRQSLDEQEVLVRTLFNAVKDKQLKALAPPGADFSLFRCIETNYSIDCP